MDNPSIPELRKRLAELGIDPGWMRKDELLETLANTGKLSERSPKKDKFRPIVVRSSFADFAVDEFTAKDLKGESALENFFFIGKSHRKYLLEVIVSKGEQFIIDLATEYGFIIDATVDNFIGLFYLINISGRGSVYDYKTTRKISSLTHDELLKMLKENNYKGPEDYLSCIFAALTNTINIEYQPDMDKYDSLLDHDQSSVVHTAIYLYGLFPNINDTDKSFEYLRHPYLHVSMMKSVPMEEFALYLTSETVDEVIQTLGIFVPPSVDKESYVWENIADCQKILDRPDDFDLPSSIEGDAYEKLEFYTDEELIDAYAMDGWKNNVISRENLLQLIIKLRREPGWSLKTEGCESGNVISYGLFPDNYKCYRVEKLTASFDEGKFPIPDKQGEFSRKVVLQLKDLLKIKINSTKSGKNPYIRLFNKIIQNLKGTTRPSTLPKGVCVKVSSLRPRYSDLEHWLQDPKHTLVTRHGRVFIGSGEAKHVFPYKGSEWANPFTVKEYGLDESLRLYEEYLTKKLGDPKMLKKFKELKEFEEIGCFCDPGDNCHRDVILKKLREV